MALVLKNLPGNARDVSSIPGSGRSLGAGNGKSSPVFLPGKFNGQRSLVCYHPWGCKESDTNGHTYIYTHTHPPHTSPALHTYKIHCLLIKGTVSFLWGTFSTKLYEASVFQPS